MQIAANLRQIKKHTRIAHANQSIPAIALSSARQDAKRLSANAFAGADSCRQASPCFPQLKSVALSLAYPQKYRYCGMAVATLAMVLMERPAYE